MNENSDNLPAVSQNKLPESLQEKAWEMVQKYKEASVKLSSAPNVFEAYTLELKDREPSNIQEYIAKFLILHEKEIVSYIFNPQIKEKSHYSVYQTIFQDFAKSVITEENNYPELCISPVNQENINLLVETFTAIYGYLNKFAWYERCNYVDFISFRFSEEQSSLANKSFSVYFNEATILTSNNYKELIISQVSFSEAQKSISEIKDFHRDLFLTFLAIIYSGKKADTLNKQYLDLSSEQKIKTFLNNVIFSLLSFKSLNQPVSVSFELPEINFSRYETLLKVTKYIFNQQLHRYTALQETFPSDRSMESKATRIGFLLDETKETGWATITKAFRNRFNKWTAVEKKLNITTSQRETIEKFLSSLNSIVTLWNIGHTYAEKSEFEDQQDYGRFLMASAKLVLENLRRNLINLEIALQNKNISYDFASLDQDLIGIENKLLADQNVAVSFLDSLSSSLEINNQISSEGNS